MAVSGQTPLKTLMEKEVTRKEFLGTVAMAVLIVMNIEPIVHLFTKGPAHIIQSSSTDYGGKKSKDIS